MLNIKLLSSKYLFGSIFTVVVSQVFANTDTAYHAQLCEDAIGVSIPAFNCRDVSSPGGSASILNGQTTTGGKCDKPAKLNGSCAPQSVGGVLFNSPDAKIYLSCRSYNNGSTFSDVAVIAVNRNNGAACFFQTALGTPLTADQPRRPILPVGEGGEAGWFATGGSCLTCHSNGGLIRSPYMAATNDVAHQVHGTGVNYFYTDNTPLWNVILPEQEVYSISAVDDPNTQTNNEAYCTSCHRLSAVWDGSQFNTSGTSSHYALAAHADNYDGTSTGQITLTSGNFSKIYQPKNQGINSNKNPNSTTSPLWMYPGATSFSANTFTNAARVSFCTETSTPSTNPSICTQPIKSPRPSDLGIWGNGLAKGKFGGETSSSISSLKNDADTTRKMFYPIMSGYFNTDDSLDLAWREPVGTTGYKWVFYLGNKTGTFTLAPFSYTWNAARPANEFPFVGDFNGDGKTDIGIRSNNQWIIKYN
ncbi:MAG TPA: VCBS repeat-containing protein, partial [Cellvibrionaceae bacterium]|nr:VCBS repeat-containing protein [Cellvibrionaceae bacterium]